MRLITPLCILVLGCSGALAASTNPPAAPEPKGAPKVAFDSLIFNFGKVKAGETVKHEFVFTNIGTATLEITDVKAGCGCTTAGSWDKKVEPGKTGMIPLAFNSTGFGGQVDKSATVTCNDPTRGTLMLQLAGTVWKPIDVSPAMAMFTPSSEAPTNETRVVRIVNNLDESITLSDLQCNNPAFKTQLKEVKPGKEFELLITAVPPFASPTVFATITLKTSSTNMPLVSVSAYANVQQAVTVTPMQLMLSGGLGKAPVSRAVQVRNTGAAPFEVSDARLDLSGVEVKVATVETGRVYSITLNFPAGFEIPAGQRHELTFKTSHPKHPLMRVPIIQMPPVTATPAAANPGQPRPASPQALPQRGPLQVPPVPAPAPMPPAPATR